MFKKYTWILVVILASLSQGCKEKEEMTFVERLKNLDQKNELIVQKADLIIDVHQLETYKKLLQEGIQTSVAKEPGVLSLYAVQDLENPTLITVFEIYENQKAYESHIASPHFQNYKNATLHMVDSLVLTRTKPIVFAAKDK